MKKWICLLMMCWLPLSITVANAMSAHMMLNHFKSKPHQLTSSVVTNTSAKMMPCHQLMQGAEAESTQASICVDCAACDLATAFATIDVGDNPITKKQLAEKFAITQASLISIQLPPSIKPPILH